MADSDLDMSDALIREREEGRAEGARAARASGRTRQRRTMQVERERTRREQTRTAAASERARTASTRLQQSREQRQASAARDAQRAQQTATRAAQRASGSRARGRRELFGAVASPGLGTIGAPMVVELILISADELSNKHRFPLPSRLLVAFGLFSLLTLARSPEAQRAAGVFGWGLVLATFYSSANGPSNGPLGAITAIGNFMGGSSAKATTSAAVTTGPGAPKPAPSQGALM